MFDMSVTDVSVIIVNWNTREVLHDCISSVYAQTKDIELEVIIVDNASTDGSTEMIRNKFPQVKLIENPANRGFARANNQGIKVAKGRYVLLLNSDTVVVDKAIAKMVSFADDNPSAAVVGCKVINPDGTLQRTCFMFPSLLNMFLSSTYLYKIFPKSRFFGRERMTWWDRNDVREVDVVTGCFMLVQRAAIKQVGMMDERFFMYGEETDWCYRFKKAGWRIVFAPVDEIVHLGGQSSRQEQEKMILQLRGSILLFIRKHRSFLIYVLGCLLVSLFFSLRVPYWLFRAMFSHNSKNKDILIARAYLTGACKALLGAESLCER
jgi:GT2 family glycosyltransferase